ncbi:MAG: hypothetical protein AB7P02_01705 [Alphaproteobacteria bacterium]
MVEGKTRFMAALAPSRRRWRGHLRDPLHHHRSLKGRGCFQGQASARTACSVSTWQNHRPPPTARRIFIVLNARGMDQTATDVLEAAFLERAGGEEAALAKQWEVNEEDLGRGPQDGAAVARFLIGLERLAYYLFMTRRGINDPIQRFAAVMDDFDPRASGVPAANALDLTEAERAEFIEALQGPSGRSASASPRRKESRTSR